VSLQIFGPWYQYFKKKQRKITSTPETLKGIEKMQGASSRTGLSTRVVDPE
jgi:hypothetical protein